MQSINNKGNLREEEGSQYVDILCTLHNFFINLNLLLRKCLLIFFFKRRGLTIQLSKPMLNAQVK